MIDVIPPPPLDSALRRAQEYLNSTSGEDYVVAEFVPNPLQGLWIVSYTDKQGHYVTGGNLAVSEKEVYPISSSPDAEEYVGAIFDEEPESDRLDEEEAEAVLAAYGDPDAIEFDIIVSQFGGFDPSQPRAKDGKWNPGGGNDGKEDDKPMSRAEKEKRLVKALLAALDDVLAQMSSAQAKVLIEQIKYNAKQFIKGQESSAGKGGGGGAPGGDKGGKGKDGADAKGGKGGKDSKSSPADSPDSKGGKDKDAPSGLDGIIAGVSGLIKRFGEQMKDKDRKELERAVGNLKELR